MNFKAIGRLSAWIAFFTLGYLVGTGSFIKEDKVLTEPLEAVSEDTPAVAQKIAYSREVAPRQGPESRGDRND